jgi:hypothetical protein
MYPFFLSFFFKKRIWLCIPSLGLAWQPRPRRRAAGHDARLLRLALWQATLPLLPLPLPLPPGRGRPRHPVQLALVCWPTLVLLLLEVRGWVVVAAGASWQRLRAGADDR